MVKLALPASWKVNLFRGISSTSVDVKGRMGLPQKHREIFLGSCMGKVVVTIDAAERCLLVYALHEWNIIQQRLESLSNVNQGTRMLQRLLIGHATDLEMDKSGRILLPSAHRKYAHLGKKVVLIGQGNKLEVWSEELWQDQMKSWQEQEHKIFRENFDPIEQVSI